MASQPSPHQIERAMSAAMQLRELLRAESSDVDEHLLADTLEGQSDIMELLDRIIENSVADRLMAEMGRARAKRFDERADKCRNLARTMMEELGLERLERAVYTASLISGPQSVMIPDPGLVPPAFQRTQPDKELIKRALLRGERVLGAELSNPATVLRVVTK